MSTMATCTARGRVSGDDRVLNCCRASSGHIHPSTHRVATFAAWCVIVTSESKRLFPFATATTDGGVVPNRAISQTERSGRIDGAAENLIPAVGRIAVATARRVVLHDHIGH